MKALPYLTLTYDVAGNELTPWGVLPIMGHMLRLRSKRWLKYIKF